jgi:hypothetical protein
MTEGFCNTVRSGLLDDEVPQISERDCSEISDPQHYLAHPEKEISYEPEGDEVDWQAEKPKEEFLPDTLNFSVAHNHLHFARDVQVYNSNIYRPCDNM